MLDLLAAGAGIAGKAMDMFTANKNRDAAMKQAQANQQLQLDFAKSGVQWRVQDAKAAGIHPLAALGMQGPSYSPVSLGDAATPSTNFAGMGQDVSRAIQATRDQGERDAAYVNSTRNLELQGKRLDNAFKATALASAVKRTSGDQVGPPLPTGTAVQLKSGKLDDSTPLVAFGRKLGQDRGWSDGQTFEDRWGDVGGSIAGLGTMGADLYRTGNEMLGNDFRGITQDHKRSMDRSVGEWLWKLDRATRVW